VRVVVERGGGGVAYFAEQGKVFASAKKGSRTTASYLKTVDF